jgi:hypothetical protein
MRRVAALCLATAGCANIVGLGDPYEHVPATTSGAGGGGGSGGSDPGCGGDVLWAKQFGDDAAQRGRGIAVRPDGSSFLTGDFGGKIDFGGASLAAKGNNDVFYAHLDPFGDHRWSGSYADESDQDGAIRVATTSDGGVVLGGNFGGTVDFGDGAEHTATGADGFVVRYDAQGAFAWKVLFLGGNDQKVLAVAVDPSSGDVVVGGHFKSQISLGEDVFYTVDSDAFIARYTQDGIFVRGRPFAAEVGEAALMSIDIDARGLVLFGGHTHGPIDVGDGTLPIGDGSSDIFVGVWDGDDEPQWTRGWTGSGQQHLWDVAFDDEGLTLAGKLDGSVELGGQTVFADNGLFVTKLDGEGNPLRSRAFDGVRNSGAVAVAADGSVVWSGKFQYQTLVEENGPAIFTAGGYDGLVVKLDRQLEPVWHMVIGSTEDDDAQGVDVDAAGNVYALAQFRDAVALPGCATFTANGLDTDILLFKRRP